jgi:hypothetical protein
MCVSPQALLDAIVARVRDGGERVERRDLETLLAARCTHAQIVSAFERARSVGHANVDAIDAALALLRAIDAG